MLMIIVATAKLFILTSAFSFGTGGGRLDISNEIRPNVVVTLKGPLEPIKYAHVLDAPPLTAQHMPGRALELRCGIIGSPAPTMRWLKNYVPIPEKDFELNVLSVPHPNSRAKLEATLVISKPSENLKDVYTCLAESGENTDSATTTVFTVTTPDPEVEAKRSLNLTLALYKPKITLHYLNYFSIVGAEIILPCNVHSVSHFQVFWRDNNGDIINGRHPSMTVLESGHLLITGVRWSDSGMYLCTATNAFGSDEVATYVYPNGLDV